MEFYYTAADEKPFHDPDLTCSEYHGTYAADQEWLECNVRNQ